MNEIAINITLTYNNPEENIVANQFGSGAALVSINVEPGAYERNVVAVTTSKAAIPFSVLTALGYCLLHNCDSVSSISIFASGSATPALLTLLPGEWQLVRFNTGATPNAQGTGTALLEYFAIDN